MIGKFISVYMHLIHGCTWLLPTFWTKVKYVAVAKLGSLAIRRGINPVIHYAKLPSNCRVASGQLKQTSILCVVAVTSEEKKGVWHAVLCEKCFACHCVISSIQFLTKIYHFHGSNKNTGCTASKLSLLDWFFL